MIGNFGFHYNKAWFNCTYTTKRDSTVHIQQNVINCTYTTKRDSTVHIQQNEIQLYIYNKTWFNCTYTTKRDSTVHIQQNVTQLYIYNKTWFNCTYTTKRDSTVHIQQNWLCWNFETTSNYGVTKWKELVVSYLKLQAQNIYILHISGLYYVYSIINMDYFGFFNQSHGTLFVIMVVHLRA